MAEGANTQAFSACDQPPSLHSQNLAPSPLQYDANKHEPSSRDRDSGVFLSDTEDTTPSSTPSRQASVSLKGNSSTQSIITPQRSDSTRTDRRLRRPAELNLGKAATPDASKPKSELELRYDLIRNSQTRSRAALKSPTQLLKDRLNLSPKKEAHEEKVRIFTPPRPMQNGCILPGPGNFTGKDVRAKTEKGRPAWWCKFDKLVIFDRIQETESGETRFMTRSSKGLSISRRRGDLETVVIPMSCEHCKEMLNRSEWKYDVQVCSRGVCWDCRERCRWEMEQEAAQVTDELEPNRERADSVLQDQQVQEEELMRKVGIEMHPKSPIESVGGIDERLEES